MKCIIFISVIISVFMIFLACSQNGPTAPNSTPSDSTQGTWATKASMPTAISLLSISVVNSKIYAIGGDKAAVEEYDPTNDNWTIKTPCQLGERPFQPQAK